MKFSSKIAAVMAVRNIGIPVIEYDSINKRHYIVGANHSLKECTEMVEAIMLLGVIQYLNDEVSKKTDEQDDNNIDQ